MNPKKNWVEHKKKNGFVQSKKKISTHKKQKWLTCEFRKKTITANLWIQKKKIRTWRKEWLTCESRLKKTITAWLASLCLIFRPASPIKQFTHTFSAKYWLGKSTFKKKKRNKTSLSPPRKKNLFSSVM